MLYKSGDPYAREKISQEQFEDWEKHRAPEWEKIYDPKKRGLERARNWHSPRGIDQMLDMIPGEEAKKMYNYLCSATHLSPFTNQLSGGRYSFGLPLKDGKLDTSLINIPIIAAFVGMDVVLDVCKEKYDLEFDLEVTLGDVYSHLDPDSTL